MKIDESNKYQLIDQYLSGDLSTDDVDKFKAFMQGDKDLTLEVNIISEMSEAAAFESKQADLKETLNHIRKSDPTIKAPILKYAAVAGALALLLFLMFKFFAPQLGQENTTDEIYQQFAMVEPLALTTKSADLDLDLREIQLAFNKENYEEVLPFIHNYLTNKPKDLDVLLAQGISLMKTNQLEDAHKTFDNIKALNPRVKQYQWYQALTYLKQGQKAEAKKLLLVITNTNSYNSDLAKKLITKL